MLPVQMPSPHIQNDGYNPIALQHIEMERPVVRQTLSTDTAASVSGTLHGDSTPLVASSSYTQTHTNNHVGLSDNAVYPSRLRSEYDAEQARSRDGLPRSNSRTSSWDILDGIKKFRHGYEEFDPKNASDAHLAFADGDIPKNKVSLFA